MPKPFLTLAVNASNSGANQIVPAPSDPSRSIVVYKYTIVAAGAVAATFLSGTTPVTGPMQLAASGNGIQDNYDSGVPHFYALPGQALNLSLSSGVQVGGYISFNYE